MKKIVIFLLFLSFISTPLLFAEEAVDTVWQSANSPVYGTKFGGMLGRGLLNIATCFVDVIVHVVEGSKQGPPVVGTLTGLGSGIGCTALRVTSGALDVLTFWVPDFNGFPVSRSYKNCLEFEEGELGPTTQEIPAPPALTAEDYAKPAGPPAEEPSKPAPAPTQRDVYDYVKK